MNLTPGPKLLAAVCATLDCGLSTRLPVAEFRVGADARGLVLMWPCNRCGCGWVRPTRYLVAVLRAAGLDWSPQARDLAARAIHPTGR